MQNKKILIKKYGGKIVAFKDLPPESQLALIQYMALDGSAWDYLHENFEGNQSIIAPYIKKYGKKKFGIVTIPMDDLKKLVMECGDLKHHSSFAEYHEWYCNGGGIPNYDEKKKPWPVIISSFNDEAFEDGWHRFHCYVRQDRKEIPCLYYPDALDE